MKKLKGSKTAQIEVTFNWFYVLIAGGVILLFFAGIIVKQQISAEKDLSSDLVRIMDSIFIGAGVSEQTKNLNINLGGLAEYTLYFDCEIIPEKGGLGTYGIKGMEGKVENNIEPIFAPLELKTPRLMLWSLPYKLPFKVQDFLFVTSPNIQYFVMGNGIFKEELLNSTMELMNFRAVESLEEVSTGKNNQVRIIDLGGGGIKAGQAIPDQFGLMDLNQISAISFKLNNQVEFFRIDDLGKWESMGIVNLISIENEKDAAKYAAIFSGSPSIYECNMQKAFQRLSELNRIYVGNNMNLDQAGGKLLQLINFYNNNPDPIFRQSKAECLGYLQSNVDNLQAALLSHTNNAQACLEIKDYCVELINSASQIKVLNHNLGERGDCLTLY